MRGKRIIAGLLAITALFGTSAAVLPSDVQNWSMTASALDLKAWGDNATYTVDNATGTVTVAGEGDLLGGTRGNPLKGDASIKKVIISEGITSISSEAFSGCTNLAEVEIADSVTSIGSDAFKDTALYEEQKDLHYILAWKI